MPRKARNPGIGQGNGRDIPGPDECCQHLVAATGEVCKRWPVPGLTTCRAHSAVSHLTREQVDALLAGYADMALSQLVNLTEHARDERVRMQSAIDLLDRAGYKAATRVDLSTARTLRIVIGPEDEPASPLYIKEGTLLEALPPPPSDEELAVVDQVLSTIDHG